MGRSSLLGALGVLGALSVRAASDRGGVGPAAPTVVRRTQYEPATPVNCSGVPCCHLIYMHVDVKVGAPVGTNPKSYLWNSHTPDPSGEGRFFLTLGNSFAPPPSSKVPFPNSDLGPDGSLLIAWVAMNDSTVSCMTEALYPSGNFSLTLGSSPLYPTQYLNFTYSTSEAHVVPVAPPDVPSSANVDYVVGYNISVDDWSWGADSVNFTYKTVACQALDVSSISHSATALWASEKARQSVAIPAHSWYNDTLNVSCDDGYTLNTTSNLNGANVRRGAAPLAPAPPPCPARSTLCATPKQSTLAHRQDGCRGTLWKPHTKQTATRVAR